MTLQALVCLKNGQPVTTSLLIAEHFNKKHLHVLRDIEALLLQAPECKSNFGLSYQSIDMPKGGTRPQPFYEITRDGFTLLAMGFTGREALRFKLDYIAAFNALEQQALTHHADRERLIEALKDAVCTANPLLSKTLRYKGMGLSNVETAKLIGVAPCTVDRAVKRLASLELLPHQQVLRVPAAQLNLLEG